MRNTCMKKWLTTGQVFTILLIKKNTQLNKHTSIFMSYVLLPFKNKHFYLGNNKCKINVRLYYLTFYISML